MCVFFSVKLSVRDILSDKNARIFEMSIFSDRKVNLVGTFRRSKLRNLSIQKASRKRQEKLRIVKKVVIFTQTQFLKKSIYYFGVTQKL